jgi:hypothetical protein
MKTGKATQILTSDEIDALYAEADRLNRLAVAQQFEQGNAEAAAATRSQAGLVYNRACRAEKAAYRASAAYQASLVAMGIAH